MHTSPSEKKQLSQLLSQLNEEQPVDDLEGYVHELESHLATLRGHSDTYTAKLSQLEKGKLLLNARV